MSAIYLGNITLMAMFSRITKDESGQTKVDYVMLLVLVALAFFILAPHIRDGLLGIFINTFGAVQ